LGLSGAVEWHGWVDLAVLPAFYSGADVFVFSGASGGTPRVLLQAMACGAPVICANSSSLPEVVGDAALLFDPSDEEALTKHLYSALSELGVRSTLRERGIARAGEFNWSSAAQQTRDIYSEVQSQSRYGRVHSNCVA
jgi:glycosyltransferase involved in cell wall biosynthesis